MPIDFTKGKNMQVDELVDNPWLAQLSMDSRQALLKVIKHRSFLKNQCVHSKMSPGDALYCVLSGEVRISATTSSGEEIVFTRFKHGQWFGEISLLDGGSRTHDAYTTEESELAIIPKHLVVKIYQKHPDVYQALVNLLCLHSRQAFSAIDDFLLFTPAQRMARAILTRLKQSQDRTLSLTQKELGAVAGISRQSANKILKQWQNQGWITRGYHSLTIEDSAAFITLTAG